MPISINPPYDCTCDCGKRFQVAQVADHSALSHPEDTNKAALKPKLHGPRAIKCPGCGKTIFKDLSELGVDIGK